MVLTNAAVRDLAAFGPFFAVQTHTPGSLPREPWHAMRELAKNPDILRDRVDAVRAHLATASGGALHAVELRVAASVTHLGLVARLISPTLALAVTTGDLLELDPASTRWQRMLGGAFPLSIPLHTGTNNRGSHANPAPKPEYLAHMLARQVLDGPVRDLVQATLPFSVSPRTLWGNVASAVNGAASMIATCQPVWADRSRMIASLLLDQPPLHNTSTTTISGAFRRRSCCLIYRAAPHATATVCGDCILSHDPPLIKPEVQPAR
jgi:hypothetical protein